MSTYLESKMVLKTRDAFNNGIDSIENNLDGGLVQPEGQSSFWNLITSNNFRTHASGKNEDIASEFFQLLYDHTPVGRNSYINVKNGVGYFNYMEFMRDLMEKIRTFNQKAGETTITGPTSGEIIDIGTSSGDATTVTRTWEMIIDISLGGESFRGHFHQEFLNFVELLLDSYY